MYKEKALVCKLESDGSVKATYLHWGDPKEVSGFLNRINTHAKLDWLIDRGCMLTTQDNAVVSPNGIKDSFNDDDLWVKRADVNLSPKTYSSFKDLMDSLSFKDLLPGEKIEKTPYAEYIYLFSGSRFVTYKLDCDRFTNGGVIVYK